MGYQGFFSDWKARKVIQHGDKFDSSELAEQFVPYFASGQRIKLATGEMGRVGVTTGWRPSFLLMRSVDRTSPMHRSSDHGSSRILKTDDQIVAVQVGRKYWTPM